MTINKTDSEDEKTSKLCHLLMCLLAKETQRFVDTQLFNDAIDGKNLFDAMASTGLSYLNYQIKRNIEYLIFQRKNPSKYINTVKRTVEGWLLRFDNEFNQGKFEA